MDFMALLFYNDLLDNRDIYEIANLLTNKISDDDDLINILVNGTDDDNNKKLFENYLKKRNINYFNPKKALIAKIFYYILHNRIGADEGIAFVANNISVFENTTNYVGDDVGIEHILGNYYAIADGDIIDRKGIDETEKILTEEVMQYIHDNLTDLHTNNTKNISKGKSPKAKPENQYLIERSILPGQDDKS